MGQIFNRLKRISSSYVNDNDEQILHNFNSQTDDSDEKLKRIINDLGNKKLENIKNNNPYQVLETNIKNADSEVKEAYLRKIREYHPDKTANLGKEIQDLAEEKSKQINCAFEQIKKERKMK